MEPVLKHRLIGAAVLSALAIIFLPKLIVGKDPDQIAKQVPLTAPAAPKGQFDTQELPLDTPASNVPAGGVVGMNASHPLASPAASSALSSSANEAAVTSAVASAPAAAAASPASPAGAAIASPAKPDATSVPVASGKSPAVAGGAASPASTAALPVGSPATEAAAIPAAQSGGHYVVSLGTYSNAGNAHALVASLKGKGLPAYADAVSMSGGKSGTRVRIGPFQQRGDAEAARLRAQQIRTDMPANVVALDAATPAADVPIAPATAASPKANPASASKPQAVDGKAGKPSAAASGKNASASPAADQPAVPSPAAAGRGYAVQVSAYASEGEANALRDKLHGAGFVAFVQKIHAESGTRWRVRVGPEADKAAADRLRSELSTKMNLSGMVVDYP